MLFRSFPVAVKHLNWVSFDLESFLLISVVSVFSVFTVDLVWKPRIYGKFYSQCFLKLDFFQTKCINVSFSLVKYLVSFMKFLVFSVISGVSGDSGESTWPKYDDTIDMSTIIEKLKDMSGNRRKDYSYFYFHKPQIPKVTASPHRYFSYIYISYQMHIMWSCVSLYHYWIHFQKQMITVLVLPENI